MLRAQQRGELPGGRRLYWRPREDAGEQGGLLVLLGEKAGRDRHHLPGVQTGEVAQLPDGERSVGQHRLDGGEREVGGVGRGGGEGDDALAPLTLHARV